MTELTLFPRYYLRHPTPSGLRFAYPITGIAGAGQRRSYADPITEWAWEAAEPAGTRIKWSGDWLIADRPLVELARRKPGPRTQDGYRRHDEPRAEAPLSPEALARFEAAPERATDADAAHWLEHDAPHACWRCAEFRAFYRPHHVQGPEVREVQTFEGWAPLDAQLDEHPDRTWTVSDASLTAIYGAHTGHLWPGYLTGLRGAVIEALRAHPLVAEVIHYEHHNPGEVTARVQVPFEPRRTRTTQEKDRRYPRRKPRPVTRDVFGLDRRIELQVPDRLAGATKAAAVAAWDGTVTAEVSRFVPVDGHSAVCGACDGVGMVSRGG